MKAVVGLVLTGLVLSGCMTMPKNWSLANQGKFYELQHSLEQQKKVKGPLNTADLYYYCTSLFKLKKFNNLFSCLDELEQGIEQGDRSINNKVSATSEHIPYDLRAKALIELGNYKAAIPLSNKAYNIVEKSDDNQTHGNTIVTLETYGLASALNGNVKKALWVARKIEKVPTSGFLALLKMWKANALVKIYFAIGEYEKALEAIEKNKTGAMYVFMGLTGKEFKEIRLPQQLMASKIYYETGNVIEAEKVLDSLLNDRMIENDKTVLWNALFLKSKITASSSTQQAVSLLSKSIEVIEQQRQTIGGDSAKIGFVGDKQGVYADLVKLLIQQEQYREAFEYVERGKARALVDMLAQRKNFGSTPSTALLTELDHLERQSLILASRNINEATTRKATIGNIKDQLLEASPELASLVSVSAIKTADIQRNLSKEEVALEYYGEGDDLYAFVLTNTSVKAIKLDGSSLSNDVASLRQELQNYQSTDYKTSTKDMYNRIIKPVAHLLTGKKLTIIPHGPLHYLPFAALNDGKSYMVDKFVMRFLPSASVMTFLNKKTNPTQDLLAFGNPDLNDPELDLPGAEEETKVINSGWKGSKVLLRKYASEANFKKFAPSFKYLHLASHGEFNPDEPLQSRMLLAPGDGEDGNLTVDELYTLRLNADMVTLSACETGLGAVDNGDDVIGLTRGFLYAGAKSIVASLWPVSDEATAYLMKRFYKNLKTMKRDRALRNALVVTKSKYPHPIFWSAFQMTGTS